VRIWKLVTDPEPVGEYERVAVLPLGILFGGVRVGTALDDAVLEWLEADPGVATPRGGRNAGCAGFFQHVFGPVPVEPFQVDGVQGIFHALEPVAVKFGFADIAEDVVPDEEAPAGQERYRCGA
jgi:hypothetical protein